MTWSGKFKFIGKEGENYYDIIQHLIDEVDYEAFMQKQYKILDEEDENGFCEVHVNTIEGFWSLLRSWLRPHRGISQEKLPLYLGFFEFVHNVRRRGKALLGSLLNLILK